MQIQFKETGLDILTDAIEQLNTREERRNFIEDLCSIHEVESLAQRLEVARLLLLGKTYVDIGKLTGVSTATISRVNKTMNSGHGMYRAVLDRQKKGEHNELNR